MPYTPESLGIKPPAGGFQTGGWYQGRQYWGGTLSEPGQIHAASDQQGAGQQVSPQVIAATNPANVSFIESERKKAAVAPVAPAAPVAPTQAPAAQPATTQPTVGAVTPLAAPQPALNLPELYKGLYESSGVKETENKYLQMERDFIEAKAKVNDNPFLSEATRVGRVSKLEQLFNERTANVRSEIVTKKADIETQLNLQTKQLDINNNQTKMAWDQLSTLISSGALTNATGEDIASITRQTGISSSLIQGMIDTASKTDLKMEIKNFDDGKEEGFIIYAIDQNGNIVNEVKRVTGKSSGNFQYSTDPMVSGFIQEQTQDQASVSIQSGWNQINL